MDLVPSLEEFFAYLHRSDSMAFMIPFETSLSFPVNDFDRIHGWVATMPLSV